VQQFGLIWSSRNSTTLRVITSTKMTSYILQVAKKLALEHGIQYIERVDFQSEIKAKL